MAHHRHHEAAPSTSAYAHENAPVQRALTAGGTEVDRSQPEFPVYHRKLGLAIPLGASGIAMANYLLGMCLIHTRGAQGVQIFIANALPVAGGGLLIAGIMEALQGSTFGATLFLVLSGIFAGFAAILMPWFNIEVALVTANAAGATQAAAIAHGTLVTFEAVGIFLMVIWAVVFVLLIASFKTAIPTIIALLASNIALLLLASGYITHNDQLLVAAGAFFLINAAASFYNALSVLLADQGSPLSKIFPVMALSAHPSQH